LRQGMGLSRGDRAHGGLSTGSAGTGGRHGTGGSTAHTSLGRRRSGELAQSPRECGHGRDSRNSGTRESAGNTRGRAQGKKGGAHMRKQGRGIESNHPYPNTRGEGVRDRRIPTGRRRVHARRGENKAHDGRESKGGRFPWEKPRAALPLTTTLGYQEVL